MLRYGRCSDLPHLRAFFDCVCKFCVTRKTFRAHVTYKLNVVMNFEIFQDDMDTRHTFDVDALGTMKRRELQALAKKCSIRANMKSADIITALAKYATGADTSTATTKVASKKRTRVVDSENVDPNVAGTQAHIDSILLL